MFAQVFAAGFGRSLHPDHPRADERCASNLSTACLRRLQTGRHDICIPRSRLQPGSSWTALMGHHDDKIPWLRGEIPDTVIWSKGSYHHPSWLDLPCIILQVARGDIHACREADKHAGRTAMGEQSRENIRSEQKARRGKPSDCDGKCQKSQFCRSRYRYRCYQ